MPMFQLHGIDPSQFTQLFSLSNQELAERNITGVIAQSSTGYPCRVSLEDAQVGEQLLLLPYVHHDVSSPYRASGPIYIRRNAKHATLLPDTVPSYVTKRLISIRAYNNRSMMESALVTEGTQVATVLAEIFGNSRISYVHLHNAKQGCFSCLATRPDAP